MKPRVDEARSEIRQVCECGEPRVDVVGVLERVERGAAHHLVAVREPLDDRNQRAVGRERQPAGLRADPRIVRGECDVCGGDDIGRELACVVPAGDELLDRGACDERIRIGDVRGGVIVGERGLAHGGIAIREQCTGVGPLRANQPACGDGARTVVWIDEPGLDGRPQLASRGGIELERARGGM